MAIGKWTRIQFGGANSAGAAQSSSQQQAARPSTGTPAKGSVHVISPADCKQFGLENFGNTCYANSVLQALYFCAPFRDLVIQYPDHAAPTYPVAPPPPASSPPAQSPLSSAAAAPQPKRPGTSQRKFSSSSTPQAETPPTLFSALRSLFLYISGNPADKGTVAPRAFIDKLKELNELFRSTMHQDAHEFLNFLLNRIVEEMEEDRRAGLVPGPSKENGNGNGHIEDLSTSITTLSSTAAPTITSSQHMSAQTLVHRLFEGVLTSETRCLTCETVSSRSESFLDLSIDIEQNSSLTACLRQFSASEMLCQRNKFFCDSCCGLQEAEKRMKIKILPPVLALHLKRFKYQESLGKYIKLSYRVAFPLELRLFNTVDDAEPSADRLYELFAVVVHIGNGPHHGHYITIVKSRAQWYVFDDESVDTIREADIPKYFGENPAGAAYVLYYQAVDIDFRALGIKVQESQKEARAEEEGPVVPPGLGGEDAPGVSIKVTGAGEHEDGVSSAPGSPVPMSMQPLSVQIPPPGSPLAGEISPSTTSASTTSGRDRDKDKGRFHIRHSPSTTIRPDGTGTSATKRKASASALANGGSSRPPSSPGLEHVALGFGMGMSPLSPPVLPPSSPKSSTNGYASGKERERERLPEKKPSTWFRRKSARVGGGGEEGERPGTAGSVTPMSPSSWFKTAGSKHQHQQSSSDRHLGSSPSSGFDRTESMSPTPPDLLATTSSLGSQTHSQTHSHSHASAKVPDVPPVPPRTDLPAPPLLSAAASVPSSPVSPRNHIPRRSGSTARRRPLPELPLPTPGKIPARPSTAGATPSPRAAPSEPMPSLPPLTPNRLREISREGQEKDDPYRRRPQSAHANADFDAPGIMSPTNSSGTAGTTWKRASRKLSITGTMLSFGRKRDKGHDKEKDVSSPPPPPSAFTPPVGYSS